MTETEITRAIHLRLAMEPDLAIWRNNTGAVKTRGTMFRYGLAPGSSDMIGLVGGRLFALEVKRPVKPSPTTEAQRDFMALVRSRGGFAAVVHSVEAALSAVARCRAGENA